MEAPTENPETYVSELTLDRSFDNHKTATGENVASARRQKKCAKYTQRAIKSIENLIRELPDDRSRVEYLLLRCEDVLQELTVTQADLKTERKEVNTLRKLIDEHRTQETRHSDEKNRLEVLLKDVQAQNKRLREETLALHKQEEEKRLHVVNKFQKTLVEVTALVQENVNKNTKLQENKTDIQNQLLILNKSCQQREQQIQCLEKQLQLQESLGKASLLKANVEVCDIKSAWATEREQWQQKDKLSAKVKLEDIERLNTMQLAVDSYIDKLEAVEYKSTINKEKSEKYKEDLCLAQGENIALLKKVRAYKERFLGYRKRGEELKGSMQAKDAEMKSVARKLDKLEKMCRKLQLDRALFLKLLQDNHIDACGDISQDN